MQRLRALMVIGGFVALTLPLMPMQKLLLAIAPAAAKQLPMRYHRLVARLLGIRVKVVGQVTGNGPLLIASNHVSWLDIVVLSTVTPLSFIAKQEVKGWPLFGALAKLQRSVFVDRQRRHATGNAHDEVSDRLNAGDVLVLFAESTSHNGASVLPFKSSFFAAAERLCVPVQPVSIAYAGHRNLPMSRRRRPFYAWYGDMELAPHLWQAIMAGPIEVTVICHEPLSTGLPRKELARLAQATVRRGLAHALHGRGEMG
jgi:lyso-ornithine lipid O-acyltransferase